MANVAQRSFAAGELAPALHARTDQVRYATGLRTCRNFITRKEGGATNRPGTRFIAATKNNAQVRLLKFVFESTSVSNVYVIEAGERYFRFYQASGQVVTSGVAAWVTATPYAVMALVTQGGSTYYCTVAHTSGAATQPGVGADWPDKWYKLTGSVYEIPSPYLAADLPELQYAQSGDVVTIVHPKYPPRALSRFGHTAWKLETIVFGPAVSPPTNLALSGGGAGATLYWAVTAISEATGEESLAAVISAANKVPSSGTPTVITWNPVSGANGYNIYRSIDGATYGFIGTTNAAPATTTDATFGTPNDSVNTMTQGIFVASAGQVRNALSVSVTDRAYDGVYRFTGTIDVSGNAGSSQTIGQGHVYYSRDGEPRIEAGFTEQISQFGDGTTGANISASVAVPDNGYTTLTMDVVPEVAGTGAGGADFTAAIVGTSWAWSKIAATFSDTNQPPDFASAPPLQPNLFSASDRYPSVVSSYQQRQLYAASNAEPEKVWASQVASPRNFTILTPLTDDASVSFSLIGNQVNAVKHLMDLGRLLAFTAGTEQLIEGNQDGILTPSGVNPRKVSAAGSGRLSPLIVVNTALYLQARGSIIRDLQKAIADFDNSDLTIFSAHLFDGYTIEDWDHAQNPGAVTWAVRSDGTLLGLTYVRDQAVVGWHRHDTAGAYENVVVVPEGTEDAVYLVVRRTVNGATKRYVERFVARSITELTDVRDLFFVDSGLTFDGRNTTAETMTLSGGSVWNENETLTITRSVGGFSAGEIGNDIQFFDANGQLLLRFHLEAFTSGTVMTGKADRSVPVSLRGVATNAWARAVDEITGLGHLEGKSLSVLGDGFVVASPNNSAANYPAAIVSGGTVTLSQPYAVIHAGLPYTSDLETLDIDSPQGRSVKDRKMLINRVIFLVEKTRGIWAGLRLPTGTDPLENLDEPKIREEEPLDNPVALLTGDFDINITTNWNANGRVGLRQVDPLPVTVLAAIPSGLMPAAA